MSTMKNDLNEGIITLESFSDPKQSWSAMNDPVMGGQSYSTVSIANGLGIFSGEVLDVPFLHAPGFITMRSSGGDYPDVSSCESLQLRAHASESYSGYRVSFGYVYIPGNGHARGYKADFNPPTGDEFGNIVIPFDEFTARWDEKTGDPVVTCQENKDFCPDIETLQNMKTISLWGEGVAGSVSLEIESIQAIGCSSSSPQAYVDTADTPGVISCSGEGLAVPMLMLSVGAVLGFVASSLLSRRGARAQKVHTNEAYVGVTKNGDSAPEPIV